MEDDTDIIPEQYTLTDSLDNDRSKYGCSRRTWFWSTILSNFISGNFHTYQPSKDIECDFWDSNEAAYFILGR